MLNRTQTGSDPLHPQHREDTWDIVLTVPCHRHSLKCSRMCPEHPGQSRLCLEHSRLSRHCPEHPRLSNNTILSQEGGPTTQTLTQHCKPVLHPVAYYSATSTPTEWNYNIYERELLAIMKALAHWRHYLGWTKSPSSSELTMPTSNTGNPPGTWTTEQPDDMQTSRNMITSWNTSLAKPTPLQMPY